MAADVTLPSGRELDIDLKKVGQFEFMNLIDRRVSDEEASSIMGKAVGMTQAEVLDLSMMDWRALFWAIAAKGMSPLANPNSVSASTSG